MFPLCFRLFPFSHMQTLFVSVFGENVWGRDSKETRGGNSQVRPLLSPVSLSAAMKDTVRAPLPPPPSHALIRFVSRLSACVHLLTELPNESQAGMLIKESDMLLKIWPSASRQPPPSRTGGCISVEIGNDFWFWAESRSIPVRLSLF